MMTLSPIPWITRNHRDMSVERPQRAALRLAKQAQEVQYINGEATWHDLVRWARHGQLTWHPGWLTFLPALRTPWQDTGSAEQDGWRRRAATLNDELVFTVDYLVCRLCSVGWVEQPHTVPRFRHCGLARAGLAALRSDNPGLAWHTMGEHISDSQEFWNSVGEGVPGGYRQRPLCAHLG